MTHVIVGMPNDFTERLRKELAHRGVDAKMSAPPEGPINPTGGVEEAGAGHILWSCPSLVSTVSSAGSLQQAVVEDLQAHRRHVTDIAETIRPDTVWHISPEAPRIDSKSRSPAVESASKWYVTALQKHLNEMANTLPVRTVRSGVIISDESSSYKHGTLGFVFECLSLYLREEVERHLGTLLRHRRVAMPFPPTAEMPVLTTGEAAGAIADLISADPQEVRELSASRYVRIESLVTAIFTALGMNEPRFVDDDVSMSRIDREIAQFIAPIVIGAGRTLSTRPGMEEGSSAIEAAARAMG